MSLWTGSFGDEYTQRNKPDVSGRAEIWRTLLPKHCRSVLEVGANIGTNLEAIQQFSNARLYATEPNASACDELASRVVLEGLTRETADKLSWDDRQFEVVFTCGVLIHIAPDKLLPSMREIYRVSADIIICGEYFAPQEEMVPYRGRSNELWRRDYGSLWLDNFPDLHCLTTFFAWKRATAFDNLIFWMFEKGTMRH